LRSKNWGKYYIGCTDNIEIRLLEHNSGRSKYTRSFMPWELKYTESYETLSEARVREKQIKGWKNRVAIEKLINKHAAFV
jgi:putative endonuclease